LQMSFSSLIVALPIRSWNSKFAAAVSVNIMRHAWRLMR